MMANDTAVGAITWTQRYETLRHYVLEGRQRLQSQPLGLALWMAKGMAGWMRQLFQPTVGSVCALRPGGGAQPGPWQQPLTVLLAQMTVPHLETGKSL
jgi:hypothetical protein